MRNSPLGPTLPTVRSTEIAEPSPRHYGRFRITGVLGSGGMGIVLAAHDPDLDRHVAIKVLHPEPSASSGGAADRLAHEARAMARLAHPNVATVYEVGAIDDRVFIAMELVEGTTLRQWITARRPWREVLGMFVAAGRGLAAAHRAGLVHRDFKPDNVLIGLDGRPRVTDFGLVASDHADRPARADEDRPITSGVTATTSDGLAGTPAYMAPEQWRGRHITAKSDQFAFCVALWEALFAERPFCGATIAELRRAVTSGVIPEPRARREFPRWLELALRRGLAVDPDARWPDLAALLDRLERGLGRRGWKIGAGAAVLSAAIAAGGAWVLAGPSAASDPCAPGVDRFASAWGDDAATAVRTAFLATGLPFAEPSFREVARQLDERHQAWTAMHRDSCLATRVRGEQSDAMLDLRAACLDRSLREVSAFVAQLRRVDRDGVRLAGQQVGSVGEVARCADVAALARRAPPPSTPDTRTRLTALSEALATVRARVLAGHHRDVAAECDALVADARALGYAPVLAEALILAASVQRETDHAARAEQLLEEAVVAADAGGDDDQRFESEVALIRVVGELLERGDDGARHAERADAILARLGGAPRRAGSLAMARAALAWVRGAYDQAQVAAQDAVARFEQVDSHGVELARALHMRAIIENEQHSDALALATEERAIALAERVLGADHPMVANLLMTKANALARLGRGADARAAYQRSREILEAFHGPDAVIVASVIGNLAISYLDEGQLAPAIELLRQTLAINEKALGPDSGQVGLTCELLGSALSQSGRVDEAEAYLKRAVAIHAARRGPTSPATASSLRELGDHYLRHKRPAQARIAYTQATKAFAESQGDGDPLSVQAYLGLGDAEVALGDLSAAAHAYQHALDAIGPTMNRRDELRARATSGLARTR